MQLTPALQTLAADTQAATVDAHARCVAANFRWEPAVAPGRAQEYGDYVGEVVEYKNWQAGHKGYLETSVHVATDSPSCAHTFMLANSMAHLPEDLGETDLLRIAPVETLYAHPLLTNATSTFWERFFKNPKDLRKEKISVQDGYLRDELVQLLNKKCTQARPVFATCLKSVADSLDQLIKQDWPHILRDRLGLVHCVGTIDLPLPVVLICYSAAEVRQARALARKKGAVASFARPTVLDGEFSGAFVPAPLSAGAVGYGHTLDLRCDGIPSQFTPELLTYPIPYLPRHIKALGFISKDHALHDGADLLAARNRHVQGLRAVSGQADFAEVL